MNNKDILADLMTVDEWAEYLERRNKGRYYIIGCRDEFDEDVWHYALTIAGVMVSDIRVEGTKTPEEALPLLVRASRDWDWDKDCTYGAFGYDVKYEITKLQMKEALVKYKIWEIDKDFK